MRRLAIGTGLLLALHCSSSSGSESGLDAGSGSGGVAPGGTAGAMGGKAGAPTSGAAGTSEDAGSTDAGVGGMTCEDLVNQYAATIELAKQCALAGSTCDYVVDTSIDGCGYYVMVEPTNTGQIAELGMIRNEWLTLVCPPTEACAVGGSAPVASSCQGNGQGGDMGVCTPY